MNTSKCTKQKTKPDKEPRITESRMTVVAGAGCYVPPAQSANNETAMRCSPGRTADELSSHEINVLNEAKRILYDLMLRQSDPLSDPTAVTEFLTHHLADRPREVFGVLHLDNTNRVIRQQDLFEGTLNRSAVFPREVVRDALFNSSAAVILYHNHPSMQSAEPSQADITLTHQIVDAMATLDIKVLDHLIVSGAHSYSFAQNGILQKPDTD